ACYAIALRTNVTRARFLIIHSDHAPDPGIAPSETNGSGTVRTAGRFAGSDEPIQLWEPSPGLRPPGLPAHSPKVSLRSMILDLLAYGAVTGLVHSVNFYRRLRERERRALFLESNLAKARLNMLKAQLQPHFLFNSLNAIAALLRRDPRLAET